jgi:hypothetical protein
MLRGQQALVVVIVVRSCSNDDSVLLLEYLPTAESLLHADTNNI